MTIGIGSCQLSFFCAAGRMTSNRHRRPGHFKESFLIFQRSQRPRLSLDQQSFLRFICEPQKLKAFTVEKQVPVADEVGSLGKLLCYLIGVGAIERICAFPPKHHLYRLV
jgi:hypothetical protein